MLPSYPDCQCDPLTEYVFQENAGPAAARNAGARLANGEAFAFTDADCIPGADWVERLVTAMGVHAAGVGGTYAIADAHHLLARMVHEEIAVRHSNLEGEVDFLGSFNVMYRKGAFDAANGFDESFKAASGEDNDLAYRIIDNGGKLVFVKQAAVAHFHPRELVPYLATQARHGFWRMKLYAKHPGRAPKGDRYAGIMDLAAPPFSFALLLCFIIAPAGIFIPGLYPAAAIIIIVAAMFYFATRLPRPIRMYKRTGDIMMMLFVAVVMVRDIARALGMIKGIWHFIIKKRTTIEK